MIPPPDSSLPPSARHLEVPGEAVLRGEPVTIRVRGLAPSRRVTLAAVGRDQFGGTWSSRADLVADGGGVIDLSRDAPVAGSWAGAGSEGPFRSMALDPAAAVVTPMVSIDAVDLRLLDAGGVELDRARVRFTVRVGVREVLAGGRIRGSLFLPEGAPPRRAVVVLGGSEGGCRLELAAQLASRLRVPALALACFGVPGSGLPAALERIPLEYLASALDWLEARPEVRAGPQVLLGVSRGAELALLVAATWPDRIRAVAASVPSAVAWAGQGPDPGAPAWTLGGSPVPFLPVRMTAEQGERLERAMREGTPFPFREVHAASIAAATGAEVAAATLPVERIGGPLLLIGSDDDGVWPSGDFVARIAARLAASGFAHPVTALAYPGAGHLLQDGYQPTTLTHTVVPGSPLVLDLGGTPEGTAAANADSWPRLLRFLEGALG